jgi:uncharacterized membrane protein YoaK (UPF0700 family)
MILALLTTNTDTTTYNDALSGAAGGAIAGLFLFLIILGAALQIISLAGMWKTASKAGQVGILACIPIVQIFIAMLIAKKPLWWVLLCLVPIVNFIVLLIVVHEISKRFGRGIGTTIGLVCLPFVFWPILGFGSAQYSAD